MCWDEIINKGKKVKEVDLYSAFIVVPHTQGTQVQITQCYLQITPYMPLPRKHSPEGASTDWGCRHLIAAYYSYIYPERMKGWVGLVGWRMVYPHKWLPISRRSSAWQQNFTCQRPTFYRCVTQPANQYCPNGWCWHCVTILVSSTSELFACGRRI